MPDLIKRRITFGSDEVPAYIATSPKIIRSERKMTVTPVAGTNREVVEMEDAWEPYDQPYSLFIGNGKEDSIQEEAQQVAEILYKNGWQELYDDYEPDIYRLAYFKGPFDIENRYTRLGKFDITFRCRPERFLLFWKNGISVANNGKLYNPTKNKARPLVHIEGSGNGTLTIQGQVISITGMADYLNIDSDIMDCFRLPSENKNNLMTGAFPVLFAGENNISFTGGITSVTITPRFYIL